MAVLKFKAISPQIKSDVNAQDAFDSVQRFVSWLGAAKEGGPMLVPKLWLLYMEHCEDARI